MKGVFNMKAISREKMREELEMYLNVREYLIDAINEDPPEDMYPWEDDIQGWYINHSDRVHDCIGDVRKTLYEILEFFIEDYKEISYTVERLHE